MPPPPTQGPATPTISVDPQAKPQIEEIYRLLNGWAKVMTEMGQKTDRVIKAFGGMHAAAAMSRKEFQEFLARSKGDQALAVGAKMRDNARLLAREHIKLNAELRKEEERMQNIQRQFFRAGGNAEDWVKKLTHGAAEFDGEIVKIQDHIGELQRKMTRLTTAIPDKKGFGAALGERFLGASTWSKIQEHMEVPRAAGVGYKALAGIRGAGSALAASIPAIAATSAAWLTKTLFDAGRLSLALSRQFDAMVDRSSEIGKSMTEVTGALGIGVHEAAEFLGDLRQAGVHASEIDVVAKDILVTQRAMNISAETQVRLFKLVSREIYGGQVSMEVAEKRTQNMTRIAGVLGQQLRQFTMDEMLEGTEQMARHLKGITSDVEALPAKFVMVSTAAGLAALGLAKARGMTDDMAKGIGKMVLGMQDAPLEKQLFGAMAAFPNRSRREQFALVGDLQSGRLLNRGSAGIADMLAMTFAPTQMALEQMLASDPQLRTAINRGSQGAISEAGVTASVVANEMPGFAQFSSDNPTAAKAVVERMVQTIAGGKSLVDENGGANFKSMLDEMRDKGDIDQKSYQQLLNLSNLDSSNKKIEKSAATIAAAQNPIKTLLGFIAAKSLGLTLPRMMKMVTGTDLDQEDVNQAVDAGLNDPDQWGKYTQYRKRVEADADRDAEASVPLDVTNRGQKVRAKRDALYQQGMGKLYTNGVIDQAKLNDEYGKAFPGVAAPSMAPTSGPLGSDADQDSLTGFIFRAEKSRGKTLPMSTASAYAAQMIEASKIIKTVTGRSVSPYALAGTAALESDFREDAMRTEPDGDYSFGMMQVMKGRTWDRWRSDPKVPLERMGIDRNKTIEEVMADPANVFKLGAYHMAESMMAGKDPIGTYVGGNGKKPGGADDVRRAEFDRLLQAALPGAIRVVSGDGLSVEIIVHKAPAASQNIARSGQLAVPGAPLPAISSH